MIADLPRFVHCIVVLQASCPMGLGIKSVRTLPKRILEDGEGWLGKHKHKHKHKHKTQTQTQNTHTHKHKHEHTHTHTNTQIHVHDNPFIHVSPSGGCSNVLSQHHPHKKWKSSRHGHPRAVSLSSLNGLAKSLNSLPKWPRTCAKAL